MGWGRHVLDFRFGTFGASRGVLQRRPNFPFRVDLLLRACFPPRSIEDSLRYAPVSQYRANTKDLNQVIHYRCKRFSKYLTYYTSEKSFSCPSFDLLLKRVKATRK